MQRVASGKEIVAGQFVVVACCYSSSAAATVILGTKVSAVVTEMRRYLREIASGDGRVATVVIAWLEAKRTA